MDSVGHLLSAHEIRLTSTHDSPNSVPPTTRSDGFLWTTTSSCCCNARSRSKSSSTCCCNTRCRCHVRCCKTLYRAKITPVHAVIFWWGLPTLYTAVAVLIPGSTSTTMKRRCNVRSENVPCLGLFHDISPPVPSAGRTRVRTSCCLRRRDSTKCRTEVKITGLHRRRRSRNQWCFGRVREQTSNDTNPYIIAHLHTNIGSKNNKIK